MLIQACLNGSRKRSEHAALPITPEEIARDAAAVMRAGAGCIHVHPRRRSGSESLEDADVRAVLTAVREACPGLPVGISTAAWIEPDLERRIMLIASWTSLPDFASVNLSEDGALEIIDLLNQRGIDVEAGVWDQTGARLLIDEGLDAALLRVLVEVEVAPEAEGAVYLAASIDAILDVGLSEAPRLHHGGGVATWGVLAAAIELGHDVRIGLEDTLVLDDGSLAPSNEALVAAVRRMAETAWRSVDAIRS